MVNAADGADASANNKSNCFKNPIFCSFFCPSPHLDISIIHTFNFSSRGDPATHDARRAAEGKVPLLTHPPSQPPLAHKKSSMKNMKRGKENFFFVRFGFFLEHQQRKRASDCISYQERKLSEKEKKFHCLFLVPQLLSSTDCKRQRSHFGLPRETV